MKKVLFAIVGIILIVILVSEDDELEVMRAFFYVDLYTNEVIGGREMAD